MVGAYFGNPELGFVLGSMVGSQLFPTQLPNGPKLTDNRTTSASLGGPVPILFGTATLSGTVMYLAPLTEHEDEGGKGGGSNQTTFHYTQTIGIGLCESSTDLATAIGGILRVWENGSLVFDIRAKLAASVELDTDAETDEAYAARLAASSTYAETFTLYMGSEDQMPDPSIEAIEGYGNVPAFRGLAYIVYHDRLLKSEQALRHPNFIFEVFQQGVNNCTTIAKTSNAVLFPWAALGTGLNPINQMNVNRISFAYFSNNAPCPGLSAAMDERYAVAAVPPESTQIEPALAYGEMVIGSSYRAYLGYELDDQSGTNYPKFSADPDGIILTTKGVPPDPLAVLLHYNFINTGIQFLSGHFPPTASQILHTPNAMFHVDGCLYQVQAMTVDAWYAANNPQPPPPWSRCGSGDGIAVYYGVDPPVSGSDLIWWGAPDMIIGVVRSDGPPENTCAGLQRYPLDPSYGVLPSGKLLLCRDWTQNTTDPELVLRAMQSFDNGFFGNANAYQVYPLNPAMRVNDPLNTEAVWTEAYTAAVAAGDMPAGLTYAGSNNGTPGNPSFGSPINGNSYPQIQIARDAFPYLDTQPYGNGAAVWELNEYTICDAAGDGASVADVIGALCHRAGLISIDVSDLASTTVAGYAISSVSSATDCIAPLRSIAIFDAVESGDVLRFVTRGKPIVATLTEDDFGCYDNDGSAAPPPSLTVARVDETTLPRRIRLHYKSLQRDYQDGEQDSPFRITTATVNDQDVSLPFCIDDTQALQAADKLWSDAWAAQKTYTLSVDQSLSWIEPGDAIAVPVAQVNQRMRVISDSNASAVLRKLTCVSDDDGSYISHRVADPPAVKPALMVIISPTVAVFMDLPALQDADSSAGFYVAAAGDTGGNTWRGCVVSQSTDGGATYTDEFSIVTASKMGTLQAAVPASETFGYDDATAIIVNVASGTAFSSVSDDALLSGANAAAMGADRRWEVVQFGDAEQLSSTQWKLTRLLRGRRGTEHVLGSSVAGDRFVTLTAGNLRRVQLNVAELGQTLTYKVTSIAARVGSSPALVFAGHGEALMPFSPVDVIGVQQDNGDVLISWARRDRMGRTLMSGVDMPMSEATLAFQVDIYSAATPPTVLRTLAVTTQSALYTQANQSADFGAAGAPSSITVAVYQMSAVVGRGSPARVTLPITGVIVPPAGATLASLALTATGASLESGATQQQFQAAATFSDGTSTDVSAKVTWSSSNPAAARVSTTGLVRRVASGSTIIGAQSGGVVAPTVSLIVRTPLAGQIGGAAQGLLIIVSSQGSSDGPVYSYYDSPDGVTWTSRGAPAQDVFPSFVLANLTQVGGSWFANQNGTANFWKITGNWYSTPWTRSAVTTLPTANVSGGFYFPIIHRLNGQWVSWCGVLSQTQYSPIVTSADYVTWTDKAAPTGMPVAAGYAEILWDAVNSRYLVFANLGSWVRLYRSTDLVAFTEITTLSAAALGGPVMLYAVAQNGANLVAVGYGTVSGFKMPMILYSTDSGNTWARSATSYPVTITTGEIAGVVFDGTYFVIAARQNFGHSLDGAAWTWNDTGDAVDYRIETNGAGAILVQGYDSSGFLAVQTSTDHGATFAFNFAS